VFFGYYNDSTDAHMEENYFLHFHTLPKLKVFYKGEHTTYNGGHRSSHIKNWVKRIMREPSTKSLLIRDDPHLEELSKSMDFITVFAGDLKGANYKEYIEAMKIYSTKALFAHTHDDAVILKLLKKTNDGVKNSLELEDLKGDEIFLIATEKLSADVGIELMDHQGMPFTKSMITRAIKDMQTFSIIELTEQMANIHTERKERFIVMADRDQGHQQSMFEIFCGKNAHAFKCYYLDRKNKDTEHMWKINMGIELDGTPQIVLLRERPEVAPVKKYLLKTFDSVEDIHTFYQKSIDGEWPPYYKTEVLPAPDFSTNQSVATSRNLMEILKHDSEEDVLLYISSQSCSFCADMNPIWEKAAG
jgi:fructose-specific phosphotransferase system component IIB